MKIDWFFFFSLKIHFVIPFQSWSTCLWIKARSLGQGWTRPAGRAPGRRRPGAVPKGLVQPWHKPRYRKHITFCCIRRTVIRLAHHIMANRDITEDLFLELGCRISARVFLACRRKKRLKKLWTVGVRGTKNKNATWRWSEPTCLR